MSATIEEIITEAQSIIGEVAGPGVQAYGEDIMLREVVRGFNLIFKKYHWDQYLQWYRLQLDGSTGIITTDGLSDVKDFEDILAVHVDAAVSPLGIMPKGTNPYAMPSGTTPKTWASLSSTHANYAGRKIIIYPIASTGYINVHAKVHPKPDDDWSTTDTLYLDKDLLALATAFVTMAYNGLNADGADIARTLMEARYKDILNALSSRPMSMNRMGGPITEWSAV